jgi:hypothetical protein
MRATRRPPRGPPRREAGQRGLKTLRSTRSTADPLPFPARSPPNRPGINSVHHNFQIQENPSIPLILRKGGHSNPLSDSVQSQPGGMPYLSSSALRWMTSKPVSASDSATAMSDAAMAGSYRRLKTTWYAPTAAHTWRLVGWSAGRGGGSWAWRCGVRQPPRTPGGRPVRRRGTGVVFVGTHGCVACPPPMTSFAGATAGGPTRGLKSCTLPACAVP